MADTLDNIVGNYNSEELQELYSEDQDAFNEAIQAEIDDIVGEDGIDEKEQEEIDTLLNDIDAVGAAWNEDWEALDALETGDMTEAEKAEREGLMDSTEEIMDMLQEAISVAKDYVETIHESVIEIGDDGGKVEATENTAYDITVQLDGNSDPFANEGDNDGLIYNVVDEAEANVLEAGRIPITIDTPSLTLQSYNGNTIVFTYEAKDEDGNSVQRKITINDYDYKKYVIYFEGDSITSDMVDNGTLANWHTDILGSSISSDDEWSLNVRVNGPSAWNEFGELTGDTIINQAIGYIPEAASLGEAIKSSWETLWEGYINGDVDGAWAEVVGQYQGEQQKALIEAMVVSTSLDSNLVEFFPTFFDSYGPALQSLLDIDYENPTASGLTAFMLINENMTAGDLLYPETLFGSEGFEDMGEVKNPDIAIKAINNVMDISALSGQTYSSYLDEALTIQEDILAEGGYFNISAEQYDSMVATVMSLTVDEEISGVSATDLKNALVQALAQFQAMGTTTVEEARTNFLTVVNSMVASLGNPYMDDLTAGLLYLLMTADGGTTEAPSFLYESLVGNGDANSFMFMSQIEPLINNGSGEPIYFDEIKEDFAKRGYEFEIIEEPAAPEPDTTWDGALLGGFTLSSAGFLFMGPTAALIGGIIGFFGGGNWDAATNKGSTIIKDIGEAVKDFFTF